MAGVGAIPTDERVHGRTPLAVLAGIGALQATTLLVMLVRGKLGAVTLGPEGVGILGVLDPLVQTVAHVSSFGLPIAAVRFLSQAHSDGPAAFAASFSRFLRRVLAGSVVGTLAALGLVWLRPDMMGPVLRPYGALLALALLGAPLLPLRDLLTNALAAARATRASAALALWAALGSTAGALGGVVVGGGVSGFLAGTIVGTAAVLLATAARLPKALGLPQAGAARSLGVGVVPPSGVATTALVLWACFLSYPLTQFLARHVVLARFGSVEAGLLQAGLSLSGVLALLLGPATALYLAPIVNRPGPTDLKGRIAVSFLRELNLAVALLALPLVLFPRQALTLLFAPSFERGAGALSLLVVGQSLRVLAGVFHVLLVGLDDVKAYGALVVLGQVSFGLMSWGLGSRDGVRGVAIAFLLSSLALLLLTAGRAAWRHGVRFPWDAAALLACGVLVLLALGTWFSARPSPDLAGAIARMGLGLALAAGLVLGSRRSTPDVEGS